MSVSVYTQRPRVCSKLHTFPFSLVASTRHIILNSCAYIQLIALMWNFGVKRRGWKRNVLSFVIAMSIILSKDQMRLLSQLCVYLCNLLWRMWCIFCSAADCWSNQHPMRDGSDGHCLGVKTSERSNLQQIVCESNTGSPSRGCCRWFYSISYIWTENFISFSHLAAVRVLFTPLGVTLRYCTLAHDRAFVLGSSQVCIRRDFSLEHIYKCFKVDSGGAGRHVGSVNLSSGILMVLLCHMDVIILTGINHLYNDLYGQCDASNQQKSMMNQR